MLLLLLWLLLFRLLLLWMFFAAMLLWRSVLCDRGGGLRLRQLPCTLLLRRLGRNVPWLRLSL